MSETKVDNFPRYHQTHPAIVTQLDWSSEFLGADQCQNTTIETTKSNKNSLPTRCKILSNLRVRFCPVAILLCNGLPFDLRNM
jgi:hypothetical protein